MATPKLCRTFTDKNGVAKMREHIMSLSIRMIHDREFTGDCGSCTRTGLRWVAELSDGSFVGLECAKKVLGFKPLPKTYNWMEGYTLTATYIECAGTRYEVTHALYIHPVKGTAATRAGVPTTFGGARAEWISRGWLTV